ncbi:UNVERIFIED_CONTAM: DNA cytosine methyltransferase, partial [Cronobacter sakazakii]
FPDHFIFSGPKSNQMLQVGNAVPPLLAYAIAHKLKDYIA